MAGWQSAAPQSATAYQELVSDPRWKDIPGPKKQALMRKFARKILAPEVGGGQSPHMQEFFAQEGIAEQGDVDPWLDAGASVVSGVSKSLPVQAGFAITNPVRRLLGQQAVNPADLEHDPQTPGGKVAGMAANIASEAALPGGTAVRGAKMGAGVLSAIGAGTVGAASGAARSVLTDINAGQHINGTRLAQSALLEGALAGGGGALIGAFGRRAGQAAPNPGSAAHKPPPPPPGGNRQPPPGAGSGVPPGAHQEGAYWYHGNEQSARPSQPPPGATRGKWAWSIKGKWRWFEAPPSPPPGSGAGPRAGSSAGAPPPPPPGGSGPRPGSGSTGSASGIGPLPGGGKRGTLSWYKAAGQNPAQIFLTYTKQKAWNVYEKTARAAGLSATEIAQMRAYRDNVVRQVRNWQAAGRDLNDIFKDLSAAGALVLPFFAAPKKPEQQSWAPESEQVAAQYGLSLADLA